MRGMSVPEGADVGPSALSPCDTCGRKFNARALEIHSRSCAKVFAAKRKTFDVAKQRASGTDLERFKRMGGGGVRTKRPCALLVLRVLVTGIRRLC